MRHSYGKVGKRANYTPYRLVACDQSCDLFRCSCMEIIMSNGPGPGDHHGGCGL